MKRWITAAAVSLAALLALTACGGPVAPAPDSSQIPQPPARHPVPLSRPPRRPRRPKVTPPIPPGKGMAEGLLRI